MCMLGMRDKEIFYLTDDQQWDADYIRAFVRCYPFVIGQNQNQEQFTVCIDADFSEFNEQEGQPLFQDNGEPTELLQRNIDFLQAFHKDAQATQGFIDALKQLDLFEPANPRMQLNSGETVQLNGLYIFEVTP